MLELTLFFNSCGRVWTMMGDGGDGGEGDGGKDRISSVVFLSSVGSESLPATLDKKASTLPVLRISDSD